MDSSIIPSTIPSYSSSTESEISTMATFNRGTFLSTYIRHQEWSLPDSIIYYISKNASSAKVYGKLIQSCKYFMIRNPPIIVNDLELTQRKNHLEVAFDGKTVDWNTVPSKIWLTNKLCIQDIINPIGQNSLSVFIPKICQSNIKELFLYNQICSVNNLKFIGSKCDNISITGTVVINENDSIVVFEDVFQLFPNVKKFKFYFGNQCSMMITLKTFQKLVKIPHFSNLQNLVLFQLPESFDIDDFYAYIKKNKKTDIYVTFSDGISSGYRNRLQAIVDEIVADESRDFKMPYINFSGIDESVYNRLRDLYYQE